MSTGLECYFRNLISRRGQGWYYFLETYPKWGPDGGDFDAYGPFKTFDQAAAHLRDHHANPGGYSTDPENGYAHIPDATDAEWLTNRYRGNR